MAVGLSDLKNDAGRKADEPIEVEAAFLVILRGNGVIQASVDINAPVVPKRDATVDEMEMAVHKIAADIQATKTAQIVQMGMQQTAAMAMQQADAQRLAQSLKI